MDVTRTRRDRVKYRADRLLALPRYSPPNNEYRGRVRRVTNFRREFESVLRSLSPAKYFDFIKAVALSVPTHSNLNFGKVQIRSSTYVNYILCCIESRSSPPRSANLAGSEIEQRARDRTTASRSIVRLDRVQDFRYVGAL